MTIEKSAVLSSDGVYRWELRRIWDLGKGLVNFIGLNPSTADGETDDPTIRRCIRFAQEWGYGGLIMTNVFAYRATDPTVLVMAQTRSINVHGRENWNWLAKAAQESQKVVCAWGAHPMARVQGERTRAFLQDNHDVTLHCIALTKAGAPGHPLYLKADLKPTVWTPPL